MILLDLRPREEYVAGHIPEARSIPFDELQQRMRELPSEKRLVAYCRGPFCVAAIRGVKALRAAGFEARRLYGGVGDWVGSGYSLGESGNENDDQRG